MTISYHSGERIQATSTDFGTDGAGIPAISGGWKEVGRTTLGSAGATIDVSSLPDKRYYMTLFSGSRVSGNDVSYRYNGDTGSNYAGRESYNGGGDGTYTSQNHNRVFGGSNSNTLFDVQYISNLAGEEKMMIGHGAHETATGAGNIGTRVERAQKWANTSVSIDEVNLFNLSAGNFNTGSEVVVLGWDETDTHTTNFWEELYSDSQTGQSTDNIDTGTFTNKKYLWVQLWCKGTANTTVKMTFNNSTDSTYAYRYSNDGNGGSADPTAATSSPNIVLHNTKANDDKFINMFIVNDGTNEILGIGHTVEGNSDGAGVAPQRRETVFKRSTATAITDIEFDNDDTGNFTDWELKVWGSN